MCSVPAAETGPKICLLVVTIDALVAFRDVALFQHMTLEPYICSYFRAYLELASQCTSIRDNLYSNRGRIDINPNQFGRSYRVFEVAPRQYTPAYHIIVLASFVGKSFKAFGKLKPIDGRICDLFRLRTGLDTGRIGDACQPDVKMRLAENRLIEFSEILELKNNFRRSWQSPPNDRLSILIIFDQLPGQNHADVAAAKGGS